MKQKKVSHIFKQRKKQYPRSWALERARARPRPARGPIYWITNKVTMREWRGDDSRSNRRMHTCLLNRLFYWILLKPQDQTQTSLFVNAPSRTSWHIHCIRPQVIFGWKRDNVSAKVSGKVTKNKNLMWKWPRIFNEFHKFSVQKLESPTNSVIFFCFLVKIPLEFSRILTKNLMNYFRGKHPHWIPNVKL